MKDRIEIIELGLDESFLKEMEEEAKLSDDIKIRIKGHLEGLKKQTVTKKAIRQQKWEGKLDLIFKLLKEAYDKDPNEYVPKTAIIETISCSEREFSPTMQKFKNYLRTTQEDKWTISKKKRKGITSYALVPFG
jgi:hypothetical protein